MATLLYRHVEADYQGADPPYTDVESEGSIPPASPG